MLKRHTLSLSISLLLCAATLLGAALLIPLPSTRSAIDKNTQRLELVAAVEEAGLAGEVLSSTEFWSFLNPLSLKLNLQELYAYNTKNANQRIFGFNKAYDMFSFMAGVMADTIRCKFNYQGRDWMVQLWKGSYAFNLSSGGEVAIYSKPERRRAEHYDAAREPDWIGMEMTIYQDGQKLFTRPYERQWWCTGYKFRLLTATLDKPRVKCTMEARLDFNKEAMARLFCEALDKKGFTQVPYGTMKFSAAETYTLSGTMVHLLWRGVTEGYY